MVLDETEQDSNTNLKLKKKNRPLEAKDVEPGVEESQGHHSQTLGELSAVLGTLIVSL